MTAFWDKLKGETPDEKSDKKETKAVKKTAKASAAKPTGANKEKAGLFSRVLVRPVISENAMRQQEKNKYVFEVSQSSNKNEISKAVQARFGVVVENVNVIRQKPKIRSFRTNRGTMAGIKKAIVSIKQGQTIELFKEAK